MTDIVFQWSIPQPMLLKMLDTVWNHNATPLEILDALHANSSVKYFKPDEQGDYELIPEGDVFETMDEGDIEQISELLEKDRDD